MSQLPFEKIKREVLIKKNATTSPEFGCQPDKRPVQELINYGIINLDKHAGPTSHQCSDCIQKILYLKKAGHSGTLDPNVTGILPTATGRATRIVQTLLKAGKEYIAVMHMHKPTPGGKLKSVLRQFTGKIKQLPPIKSAVKRQVREKEIYYLEMLEMDKQDILLRIGCEAGTYIRKLCFDIGKTLGCGAHMAELRRTKVACFNEQSNLITLQDLADAFWYWKNEQNEKFIRYCIQTIEKAVGHLPKIWVLDSTVNALCHGIDLAIPGISKLESEIKENDTVAVSTLKNELICLGKARLSSKEILKKEKGIAVETKKVFMLPDVYPRT